jgi:hypothetical protein
MVYANRYETDGQQDREQTTLHHSPLCVAFHGAYSI